MKNKRILTTVMALILAVAMVVLSGCAVSAGQVAGDWTDSSGSTYTFNKDGSGSIKVKVLSITSETPFTWSIADGVITLTYNGQIFNFSSDSKFTVGIEKDTMTFTSLTANEDGTYPVVNTFTKVAK